MRILLVASSTENIAPTLDHLEKTWERVSFSEYENGKMTIFPLVTGYASIFMPYALAKFSEIETIDYVVYAGLAAGTTRIVEIGQTVNVGRDILGDVGIEESDKEFKDMFDLKIHDRTRFPFFKGEIFNEDIINPLKQRVVKNISVNTIPGTFETIEALNKKYHAEIVTTNGAAFAYSCKMLDVKYLQLRTIYRYLEPTTIRNREREFAVRNLNIELLTLIEELSYLKSEFL
jgi:hypothetical protein